MTMQGTAKQENFPMTMQGLAKEEGIQMALQRRSESTRTAPESAEKQEGFQTASQMTSNQESILKSTQSIANQEFIQTAKQHSVNQEGISTAMQLAANQEDISTTMQSAANQKDAQMSMKDTANQEGIGISMQKTANQEGIRISMQDTVNQEGIPLAVQGSVNHKGIPLTFQGFSVNMQPIVGVPVTKKEIPVNVLRVFGGIQIILGLLLGLESIVGFGLSLATNILDIICFFCSGWFLLTGSLPMLMRKRSEHSWRNRKMAFMVCSIIGAAGVAPLIFSFRIIGAFAWFPHDLIVALSFLSAVLSFIEAIVAIVAASYCCCCTQWNDNSFPVAILGSEADEFSNIQHRPRPYTDYQQTTMNARNASGPRAQQYAIEAYQQQLRSNNHHPYQPHINISQPFRQNVNNQQLFKHNAYNQPPSQPDVYNHQRSQPDVNNQQQPQLTADRQSERENDRTELAISAGFEVLSDNKKKNGSYQRFK